MKSLISLLVCSLVINVVVAQTSDSTKTEPVIPAESKLPSTPDTSKVKTDTARVEKPVPMQEAKPEIKTGTSANENQPRIIYYQSKDSREDRQYQSRYSSRYSRKGDIKTLAGSMNHSGGFGALSFRMTDFADETMVLAGIRAGWIINRTMGIGFEGHGIIPTAQFSNIDPTQDVVALGGYGGMFLELIVLSNQVVHLTFPASAGAGWIGYNTDWESNNLNNNGPSTTVDEDIFWYVEPGANLEVNISRNFRMAVGVSKRFTQDMELINTSPDAFENLNYYVTLKIGGF